MSAIYVVYDHDSEWAMLFDEMDAIMAATKRFRELPDGLCEFVAVKRFYQRADGVTVRENVDWKREYNSLVGSPAYAG